MDLLQLTTHLLKPLQLTRTPQTVLAAMDLLVTFVKLHLLWCHVEERKCSVSSLFILANHAKNDVRNNTEE